MAVFITVVGYILVFLFGGYCFSGEFRYRVNHRILSFIGVHFKWKEKIPHVKGSRIIRLK